MPLHGLQYKNRNTVKNEKGQMKNKQDSKDSGHILKHGDKITLKFSSLTLKLQILSTFEIQIIRMECFKTTVRQHNDQYTFS